MSYILHQNGYRHRGLRLQFQRWSSLRKNTTSVCSLSFEPGFIQSDISCIINSNKYGPPEIPRRFQHQVRRSFTSRR